MINKSTTILNVQDYLKLISSCEYYMSYYVNRIREYLKENNYDQFYLYHSKKGKIIYSKEDIDDKLTKFEAKKKEMRAKNFTKTISQNKDIELCINKINELSAFLDHLEIATYYQDGSPRQKHAHIYKQCIAGRKEQEREFSKVYFKSYSGKSYTMKINTFPSPIFKHYFNERLITENQYISIKDCKNYTFKNLISLLEKHQKEKIFLHNTDFLFDNNNCIAAPYKNRSLKDYDLSKIDFDNKNISGLDLSENKNVHINFDKIRKDVSDCNFNGYDLSKVTFRNFNVQDTDFRNTSATIDLATCTLSKEGKMNPGTLLDE